MSNTIGQLYNKAPKASDDLIKRGDIVVPLFIEVDGQTYSITIEQFKRLLQEDSNHRKDSDE